MRRVVARSVGSWVTVMIEVIVPTQDELGLVAGTRFVGETLHTAGDEEVGTEIGKARGSRHRLYVTMGLYVLSV